MDDIFNDQPVQVPIVMPPAAPQQQQQQQQFGDWPQAQPAAQPPAAQPAQEKAAAAASAPAEPAKDSLQQRAVKLVAEQQKSVADRTSKLDKDTADKLAKLKKDAKTFLDEQAVNREKRLAAVKADHVKEQQDFMKKRDELHNKGAVWASVDLVVKLGKPNPYTTKGTEKMRKIMQTLRDRPTA